MSSCAVSPSTSLEECSCSPFKHVYTQPLSGKKQCCKLEPTGSFFGAMNDGSFLALLEGLDEDDKGQAQDTEAPIPVATPVSDVDDAEDDDAVDDDDMDADLVCMQHSSGTWDA